MRAAELVMAAKAGPAHRGRDRLARQHRLSVVALRRDNAPGPDDEEFAVGVADMALPDDQRDDVGRGIDAEHLGDLAADVAVDLDRGPVERAVGVDVVAVDRHRRIGDAAERDLVVGVGVGVIIAEVGPYLKKNSWTGSPSARLPSKVAKLMPRPAGTTAASSPTAASASWWSCHRWRTGSAPSARCARRSRSTARRPRRSRPRPGCQSRSR
jgi:hypothetical protein